MTGQETGGAEKGKLTPEEREKLKNTLVTYLAQFAGSVGQNSAEMVNAISAAMVRLKMT